MTESAQALAGYRMDRAAEALEEAAALMSTEHWNGAVNRRYYAAFYAAKALLAIRELDAARHSGAISLFQLHFNPPGRGARPAESLSEPPAYRLR